MKSLLCSAVLLLAFAANAQAPPAVPIPKEPHHHLVLENEYVRVFRVSVPAHEPTLLHQHDVPYIYVSLGPADVINAVAGKPEAHLTMADGQVGYSRGGFAHIARNEADTPFNNVTVELLKPQGEPQNLCEKIVDGPLKCGQASSSKTDKHMPVLALPGKLEIKELLKTSEINVSAVSIARKIRISSAPSRAQLLVVWGDSEVRVAVAGESSKILRGGEVLWVPADKERTITGLATPGTSHLLEISFEN